MKHPFSYEVIYSSRKTLAIQITAEGSVKVRAPKNCPRSSIDRFLKEKEAWVLKYIDKVKQNPLPAPQPLTALQRSRYLKIARDIFTQKTAYYAFHHARLLRTHLHPGTKDAMGKLLQPGKPQLQLAADLCPRRCAGLYCSP